MGANIDFLQALNHHDSRTVLNQRYDAHWHVVIVVCANMVDRSWWGWYWPI